MRRLCPHRFGSLVQTNAGRLLPILSLALIAACVTLNSAKWDTELASWIQRTARIEHELHTVSSAVGPGAGTSSLLLLQAQSLEDDTTADGETHILSVKSLMVHLEALAIATHVTVELFDVSWSLRDLCLSPTPPDYEGLLVNQMLDHLMPCAIKTPLDCFWEGAKLLGPDHELRLSSIGPKLKWASLNPRLMVEMLRRDHPHASFPYATLLDWMDRVGINNGYLDKPCLDPNDPNCPISAPNKVSGKSPDVGAELTGGCYGLAAKQMHWLEEEIIGGVQHNKTGTVIGARALQSTIQLMGEQDIYDYWRKTSKVQDINNWSADKAKLILESWQRRFKDELHQFTKTSSEAHAYRIHAMTPKSMLEPINVDSVTDMNNFKTTIALMTIFTCMLFPNFIRLDGDTQQTRLTKKLVWNGFKRTLMAISISMMVGLTFVASLGLCSFMNLPLNMATTQLLPPLALYYGFRQALMVANIYSQKFKLAPLHELTTECLNEILPPILIEMIMFIVPLSIATILPVTATRVFALQAITYIIMATFTSILLIPSLLTCIILNNFVTLESQHQASTTYYISDSSGILKSSDEMRNRDNFFHEENIFSRIQDDLKNIRADSCPPSTDINFTAHIGPNGFTTNLRFCSPQYQKPSLAATDKSSVIDIRQKSYETAVDKSSLNEDAQSTSLPDLVLWPKRLLEEQSDHPKDVSDTISANSRHKTNDDLESQKLNIDYLANYAELLAKNRITQIILLLFRIAILIVILCWAPNVRYGLQVKDIVIQGTPEYDTFQMREEYFPIYNIFAITKGNLDYPNNQRLMYEFYRRIEQVEGIVRDNQSMRPKFWLAYFRDWLIELQDKFDSDRNKSLISNEGWQSEASDASKLAYKLLAQTGKIDNPIDKNIVDTNRLVDKNGIINQRAFYYYLTAWVMNDAFSYSNSEANFKPEPKTWNENPDNLKIERAKPLTYAQIPFLMKLSVNDNNLKTIIDMRTTSQAFEQLNLPNFPTGIPFIFWDQFINLDLIFFSAISIIIAALFIIISMMMSNFFKTAIVLLPSILTLLEIYGLIGLLSVPFNNIVAIMVICTIGTTAVQIVHFVDHITNCNIDISQRLKEAFRAKTRIILTSLILFFLSAIVFRGSAIDFMNSYANILLCLTVINAVNSLLIVPVLLSIFSPLIEEQSECPTRIERKQQNLIPETKKSARNKKRVVNKKSKRCHGRVQSEISLSTISEEPQSEVRTQDLKFDVSIRCY